MQGLKNEEKKLPTQLYAKYLLFRSGSKFLFPQQDSIDETFPASDIILLLYFSILMS